MVSIFLGPAWGLGCNFSEYVLNNQWFSKIAVWLVIALVLFTVFKQFDKSAGPGSGYLGYSEFLDEVRSKRIKTATIQEGQGGTEIVAITNDDRKVRTTATYLDRGLVGDLIANNVKFDVKPREEGSLLMTLLVSWGPMLLLIGVWVYFMRQMQGGVQDVGAVGGGHHDHAQIGFKAVHFDQHLVQGLLALVIAPAQASAALATDRVNFIDEDDAGCIFLGVFKHIAHTGSTYANEHFHKIRT